MKKFAPIAVLFLLGAMFTSCKKEYTCQCTVGGVTTDVWTKKLKKGDAEDACNIATAGGSCKIK